MSKTQEDRVSLNADEQVARAANDRIQSVPHEANPDRPEAATSITILTSVDVPSRAGLEASSERLRSRTASEEKIKGLGESASRSFASPPTIIRPHLTQSNRQKHLYPGKL